MEISFTDIKKAISRFLHRYHVVVFTVVILGGLAAAVFVFNNIIAQSSGTDTGYTSSANDTTFDKATIDRINQLKTSSDPEDKIDFSNGRTNPFVE